MPPALEVVSAYSLLPVASPSANYAAIKIHPDSSVQARLQMHIGLVIDISGSMDGQIRGTFSQKKIDLVKAAATNVINQLQDGDAICLITFSDRAQVLIPTQVVQGDHSALLKSIHRLQSEHRPHRYMGEGIALAQQQLFALPVQAAVRKIVVLTDGQPDDGDHCYQLAEQTQIPFMLGGIGDDYNGLLLNGMARSSGGIAEYIDRAEAVGDFLKEVLIAVQATVLTSASLQLDFRQHFRPNRIHQVSPRLRSFDFDPVTPSNRHTQVALGDIQREGMVVLVEYVYEGDAGFVNEFQVASLALRYDQPPQSGLEIRSDDFTIQLADGTGFPPMDDEVKQYVDHAAVEIAQLQLLHAAQEGNVAAQKMNMPQHSLERVGADPGSIQQTVSTMRVPEDMPTAFLDTSPAIGNAYHPHRQRWDEHIQYEYSQGMHELRVCLNGLKAAEIDAIVSGEAGFALVVDRPLLLLLFRFEGALNWSDAPFTIWRLLDARRSVPAAPVPGDIALLYVRVVSAATNTLLAVRPISLPPSFSQTLITAIRSQVPEPYEATEYARRLEALRQQHPTTMALLDSAVARCRLPARDPASAGEPALSWTSPGRIRTELALECPTTDALLPLRAALLNLLEEQDADERGDRGTEVHALLTSRDAPRLQLDRASADLERLSAAGSRRDFRELAPDCTPVRPGLWTEWVDSRTGMRQGCALLVVPSHIKLHEGRVDSRHVVEWQLFAHFAAIRSAGSAGFVTFSMVALIDSRGRLIPGQPILPDSADGNVERMRTFGQVALQTALLGLSRMNTGHAERLPGENSYVA